MTGTITRLIITLDNIMLTEAGPKGGETHQALVKAGIGVLQGLGCTRIETSNSMRLRDGRQYRPDLYGATRGLCAVIEAKASRVDFLRSAEKYEEILKCRLWSPIAQRHYIMVPNRKMAKGIPCGWGLLEWAELVKAPMLFECRMKGGCLGHGMVGHLEGCPGFGPGDHVYQARGKHWPVCACGGRVAIEIQTVGLSATLRQRGIIRVAAMGSEIPVDGLRKDQESAHHEGQICPGQGREEDPPRCREPGGLRMSESKIGEQPAFPNGNKDGMTYRQWLIGMALRAGLEPDPVYPEAPTHVQRADYAISIADAILKLLEEE